MISVIVGTCSEDKPAPKVTDDLIATTQMAYKRGEQELAEMSLIKKKRSITMPLKVYEIGSLQPFSFSKFQIDGLHRITSWNMSMTYDRITTTVEMLQTESMCNV